MNTWVGICTAVVNTNVRLAWERKIKTFTEFLSKFELFLEIACGKGRMENGEKGFQICLCPPFQVYFLKLTQAFRTYTFLLPLSFHPFYCH